MLARLAAAAAVLAAGALAECPNGCGGHGTCGPKDACDCENGYYGADCSLRVCPFGASFVDSPLGDFNHDGKVSYSGPKAYSKVQWAKYAQYEAWPVDAAQGGWAAQPGEAHFLAECSGKGKCDTGSGTCKCYEGYTGTACQRTTCANDCSGNGQCKTVSEVAAGALTSYVEGGKGVSTAFEYSLWDAEKNTVCVCDAGFAGNDCSQRVCPKGDDPLTNGMWSCNNKPCVNARQAFSVDGGQATPGTYFIWFTAGNVQLRTAEFPLYTDSMAADWSTKRAGNEAGIKAALEALPGNVTGRVVVACSGGGATQREQLRCYVDFATRTGQVAPMRLAWKGTSNLATKASFVFQFQQPVQKFTLPAKLCGGTLCGTDDNIGFKLFPQDQSTAGRSEYWASPAAVDIGKDLAGAVDADLGGIADKICDAFNAIPLVKAQYGKPCLRDASLLVRQVASVTAPGYKDLEVTFALPDLNVGANPLQFQWSKDATAMGAWTAAEGVKDVYAGTTEQVTCSNRGLCNAASGQCQCFKGYKGLACDKQDVLAPGAFNAGSTA